MKLSCLSKSALFAFALFLSSLLQAQNPQTIKPAFYKTTCLITYLDGTPAKGLNPEHFDIKTVSGSPKYVGYVTGVNKDMINLNDFVPASYKLTYMGGEVAGFTVSKHNGILVSDLPPKVHLPFNYLIKTDSICKIFVYDETGKKVDVVTTNKYGYATLAQSSDYVSKHFFVCFFKGRFPQMRIYYEHRTKYNKELRFHIIKFKQEYRSLSVMDYSMLGENTVHNLDDDIYYRLQDVTFKTNNNKNKTYWWLLIYNEAENRGSVHIIDLPGHYSKLFLDEKGKTVLLNTVKDNVSGENKVDAYFIDKTGALQPAENVCVDPAYRINGNIIYGTSWQVPTFLGEPMKEGAHTFTIACEDKKGKKLSSNVTLEVVFSPEKNKLLYKYPDGSLKDYPEYQDNSIDFSGLGELKQCYLSVDGKNKVEYTHKSSEMAKGIFYSDMTDKEKNEAVKNLPLELGWDEDAVPYDYGINLFAWSGYKSISGPINKKEGPYPELRYMAYKLTGEYPLLDEAKKHCKNPEQHRSYKKTTYQCFEKKIVSVCLDNFRYKSTDKGKIIDHEALYCAEDSGTNKKGDQVVYKVTAKGYVTLTGALKKRSLQASYFTLSGKILGDDSIPVKGAKISFEGVDSFVLSDSLGNFSIKRNGDGDKPFNQNATVYLKKTGLEIYCEDLGSSIKDTFGIVSDGFTTLKLKVKTHGIEPRTVVAKQPALGEFVGHTMLNLALVVDEDGTGTMEYVPPSYLTNEQLNKHITLKPDSAGNSLSPMLWVAEVPVTITYEDEEGNPGKYTFLIRVTRPPIMLVHGFTGNETTWGTLANYLRVRKYEPIIREYYKGPADESTIERQSEKPGKYIQEIRATYLDNHFLQNRVDIVAHSMGGLISRYYISNMAKYGKTAGIYIPYDVKLSRDELKAKRFQKPVILNDVRKLIMVGTPNHGASWIDERIGYWAARKEGYHQIASAQLRNDSPFFETLNAGESEGRHLDANVQYAIIYGIRKRSAFYLPDSWFHTWGTSQKEFASDDGVVTIASAKLNGVKDYPFPKDWYAMHGYIHSPAVQDFFPGDEPITESTDIFEQVTELLQEDIPRVPLKNSYSKIIRAEGAVKYRYFSTQNWVPVRTPIHSGNTKKLVNNWCRIKTEEGSATLGFFLNGHQWGMLHIMPNTIAYYEYASPEFVNVYMQQGKARFNSRKQNGGGFEIVLGNEGEQWYAFNPRAKVKDMNTDFTVETKNDSATIQSIYGLVAVGKNNKGKTVDEKSIGKKQGIAISGGGTLADFEVPEKGWWSSIDTTFLPDDTSVVIQDSTDIHFDLGKITLTASDKYLPVGGFANIALHVGNMPDTSIVAKLTLNESGKIDFIRIVNPSIEVNSMGNAGFNVTINEPGNRDDGSLANIPLQANFKISLALAGTGQVLAEKKLIVPVGMTLLTGKTVGPDFKPRVQPRSPELFPVSFQIANQTDENGNFYILFNTTLYNKELEKQRQYSERTGREFDKKSMTLEINWPETCSIPLKYELPDSIVNTLKAGTKITIGNNGNFDILTPEEHEQRIKKYVKEFATAIPLDEESKSYIFSQLDKLAFSYNVRNITIPTFSDNLNYNPVITIPVSQKEFWGSKINETANPAYILVFHVMGHFLQQAVALRHHRYYNFLAEKCAGNKYITTQSIDDIKHLFDKAAYISFSEAGADFFAYLICNFLKEKHPGFAANSIYYHHGYLDSFTGFEKFKSVQKKHPAWLVSGAQTAFLINYYGNACQSNPVSAYADFLFNTVAFTKLTRGSGPASTINQWLLTKHLTYNAKAFAGNSDPNKPAAEFGLFDNGKFISFIPRTGFSKAELVIDGNTIYDFSKIPQIDITASSQITFGKGHFIILIPSKDTIMMMEADSASAVKVENGTRLTLLSGTFFGDAPVKFKTSLAGFTPASNNFELSITPKLTSVFNQTGSLKISTEKDNKILPAGFATAISKKGNIKKPRPPKNRVPKRFVISTTIPFVF